MGVLPVQAQFYSLQYVERKIMAFQSFKSIYASKYKTLQACDCI